VIGQAGPAAQSAYSFAEGYTGSGFDEWLTVQNPTSNTEHLNLTVMNGNGQTYAQSLTVGPKTRLTVNVTQLVAQHLAANRSVSMTLLSQGGVPFVAERPMYWSTGGVLPTRGGTAIIGYTGQ
jgi:P pilus assembly chaperone PapD